MLLNPRLVVAAKAASASAGDGTVVASLGNCLQHASESESSARGAERSSPWLLLLGAHPAAVEQGYATSAVEALLRVWLERGGRVALGGHPTFVPIVVQQARRIVRGGPRCVRVYQSAYFPPSPALQEAVNGVELVGTQDVGTREASLTLMRRQMVADLRYVAVVAVGGRTGEGGRHRPGLAEETQLALEARLAVYLLGATGGWTAQAAEQARHDGYARLHNGLSRQDNDQLWMNEDFEWLAEMLRRHTAAGA